MIFLLGISYAVMAACFTYLYCHCAVLVAFCFVYVFVLDECMHGVWECTNIRIPWVAF